MTARDGGGPSTGTAATMTTPPPSDAIEAQSTEAVTADVWAAQVLHALRAKQGVGS